MDDRDPARTSRTQALEGLALPCIIGSFAGRSW
jgi:hypothetical protein